MALCLFADKKAMIPSYDPNDTEAGLKLLEDLTTNAETIQQQVLHQILSQNSGTQYLRAFLEGESDKNQQSFKNKVPVVNYDDIKPFIQRIADGESSDIVSSQPITELLTRYGFGQALSLSLVTLFDLHFSIM